MSTQHTWPKVAHYYTDVACIDVDGNRFIALGFTPRSNPKPTCAYYQLGSLGASLCSEYKPILRALEDITEDETEEFFNLRERKGFWDHAFAKNTYGSFKRWFLHISDAERMYQSSINCNLGYTPAEFHWLISRGFDVFGLIRSGQAIWKEAGV